MTIVRITKEENRSLRWAAKAATTDADRPILQGLNVSDEAIIGCDTFRLHAVQPIADAPQHNGSGSVTLQFGKIPASASILEAEPVEGNYPDFRQIIPGQGPRVPPDPVVICFNPSYLREALEGMEGMVELRIRADQGLEPVEILGHQDGNARYALVMPMHNGDPNRYSPVRPGTWRPGDSSPPTAEEDEAMD